jgi:hypothetical protein
MYLGQFQNKILFQNQFLLAVKGLSPVDLPCQDKFSAKLVKIIL